MTPTDVMDRPAHRFWMDARIRAAGTRWERDQQERRQAAADGPGAADPSDKEDLVRAQEKRADAREAADGQPSLADQRAAMNGVDGSTPTEAGR